MSLILFCDRSNTTKATKTKNSLPLCSEKYSKENCLTENGKFQFYKFFYLFNEGACDTLRVSQYFEKIWNKGVHSYK